MDAVFGAEAAAGGGCLILYSFVFGGVEDGGGEAGGGEFVAGDGPGTGAEGGDAAGPEVLVGEEGDDDGGGAGAQPGGRGAGAAVVDDGGNAGEEPVVGGVVERVDVGAEGIGVEGAPAGEGDGGAAAEGEGAAHGFGEGAGVARGHAAEADVDGARATVEEGEEVGRGFPLFALIEEPVAGDVDVVAPVGRAGHDVAAEAVEDGAFFAVQAVEWSPERFGGQVHGLG